MPNEIPEKHKNRKPLILTILFAIIAIGAVVFFLNRDFFIDSFMALNYNPTPAMSEIRDKLELTGDGSRIFNASHPVLSSRDDFNESCQSHDEAVSVLGCYDKDHHIFVYNIEEETLSGIRESTTAHELLHAVWGRLTGSEKASLTPILESTYASHPELTETVEAYPENERLDEIYVRLATQVAELPDELETHYAKYFRNQDAIVAFYDTYIAPFNELNEKIEKLKVELDTFEKEINTRTYALDERVSEFEDAVDEFNDCADTAGCFSSDYAFRTRRAELVEEQESINAENTAINLLIDTYNSKVTVYNQSVTRSADLQNKINSNSSINVVNEE